MVNEILGIKDDEIKFHKVKEIKLNLDLPEEYYIVFPSASLDKKKWEYEKYGELIEKIYEKTKLPVVFCGTNSDLTDVSEVIKNIKNAKYINCLGKSSVVEFIEIIRRAKFVITNDTGAYHIALKGLYLLKNNFNQNDKGYIENISNADWFKFVQEKEYLD